MLLGGTSGFPELDWIQHAAGKQGMLLLLFIKSLADSENNQLRCITDCVTSYLAQF